MRAEADEDLQPCGRRLAGDEAGLGTRVSELGDAVTGINRADSASVKSVKKIVQQAAPAGKSCARVIHCFKIVAPALY